VTEEPPKLFRVSRNTPLYGIPFWEKRILRDFCLFDKGAVAVVKNIPENNQRLWKIKHLVKIEPITFVNGEPTVKDINYTFLKENGDCVVIKNVECIEQRLEAAEKFEKDEKNLNSDILKRDSRLKWLNHF
jgi:large subunit ribosomal protein L30